MEQFAPVKRSKDGQPVRYLIVDDSVFARKNLARMIETFGGQVAAEAGDGLTAISEFDRTHPDIVLMDITMPQMEGIEAAEKIVQAHPEARVVMVSSVGYQENIVAALQRGARHFVQWPPALEPNRMKMDLIQPFINAAAAVLSQGLSGTTKVGHLAMEEDGYRRKGVAGMVALSGDIEGRIILDLEPQTAVRVASHYAGAELPESDGLIKETIFELANQVVGNAVCALNDQGFHFRVHPPLLLTSEEGDKTSEDVEALMICFETSMGNVYMNVALRHNKQRLSDHAKVGT